MHWIVWSLLASGFVSIGLTVARMYGATPLKGYIAYSLCVILGTAWSVPMSYVRAPSTAHAFFLQTVFIGIVMVIVGKYQFNETLSTYNWVGIVFSIAAGTLLAK